MTKQTMGHSVHPPSLINVLGGRIKKAGWIAQSQYRWFCHLMFQINRTEF